MKIFSFLILFIIIPAFSQSENATFFIAKDLSGFEILNRYQQKISLAEKHNFDEYPWKVLKMNTLLGDRITHAMQVEQQGVPFYFVLNADGTFKGDPQEFHEIFENCTLVNDQVKVVLEKGVLFRDIPFSNNGDSPRIYLEQGLPLKRIFKKGSSFFVKNLQNGRFGWIRVSSNKAISAIPKEEVVIQQTGFDETLVNQVEQKVAAVNSVFRQLFSYLNSQYNQKRTAPFWQLLKEEKNITLTLQYIEPAKLKISTSYFVNDIENIFADENVFVNSNVSSITISLNDENK